MREHRILVGDLPMHFRLGGKGAPVLLLHPSPSSSKALLPLAIRLNDHFTVIALDTPGYGDAPPFDCDEYNMDAYATRIHQFLNTLNIDKVAIYGSATGGQLAVRFGIMYPEQVAHLFLDNCADFPEDMRTNIIDNYFPDLKPQIDGSHLIKIWEVATHLFKYFPWCCKTEEFKIKVPELPVTVYHQVAMEYLVSGEHYHRAYRAAFHHERAAYIQELTVPATILRWQGSIVKKYTDRLFDFELPEQVDQCIIPAPTSERFDGIRDVIIEKYTSGTDYKRAIDNSLFETYAQVRKSRITTIAKMQSPPALDMEGTHLLKAWDILKSKYPLLTANTLQQMLIDWYTVNKKA